MLGGSPPLTAKAGTNWSFSPTASDADNDALSYTITGKPAWAQFNVANGSLSGIPGDVNVGETEDIEITVTDGKGGQDSIGPFRITIAAKDAPPPPANNTAPTISGSPAPMVVAGSSYIFVPTASDANNDKLSFSIANRPQWATFSTQNGQLSGTPTKAQVGTVSNIRISVSDGKATTALPAFSIQVQPPPNSAPSVSGSPATAVQAGTAYSFQPSATDPDNNTLSWTITNKPAWAAFDGKTGKLSGTPTSAQVGTYGSIGIKVSDGQGGSASLATFAINVSAAPNRAPTIKGTPPTAVLAGANYSFVPTGADPDGNTLSYSIENKPTWATFSIATGQLAGTPSSAQLGTYSNIVISVKDTSNVSAALPAFNIAVTAAPNRAPTITGAPATSVKADVSYSFTPNAADADGDALTFSIVNMPTWASFNTMTGALTGKPTAGNVGTTSGIVISVSDGKSKVSLPQFSLVVQPVTTTASVTLNWGAPTQNTDGTALQDLAGYRIRYGTSQGNLGTTVQVTSGVNSAQIDNLSSGTWYFSITAYSSAGTESTASNAVSVTLP